MQWQSCEPENVGSYIILIPAIIGPVECLHEKLTCEVKKAWFDGKAFVYDRNTIKPGWCLWIKEPEVYIDSYMEDSKLGWIPYIFTEER